MTALVTCPACGDMHEPVSRWCPNCGKWLRLTGPTASELYQRRKAQQAAPRREDSPPTKGMED